MERPRTLPNLFLLGAPKAGTTTVHRWLAGHPDVFFPLEKKEPAFFAGFHERPWCGPGASEFVEYIVSSEEEYYSLYDDAGSFRWRGDASSDYLWCPAAPAAIKASCGRSSVRLIVILRNPVTRAFSEHCHLVRDGLEQATLQESFALEEERFEAGWQPLFYHAKRGRYCAALERYFRLFGRDRVKVLFFEHLQREPRSFMDELFRFLDLPPIAFSSGERHNVSGAPRSRLLQRVLQANHSFRAGWKRLLGEKRARRMRLALESVNLKPLRMSDVERRFLQEKFAGEVECVERLLRCDLSLWRRAG